MKWKRQILALLLLLVITACNHENMPAENAATKEVAQNQVADQKETDQPAEDSVQVQPEVEEEVKAPSEEPAKSELAKDEEIALAYISEFLNSDDVESKKNYVHEHVLERRQSLFLSAASNITDESLRFMNPQVIKSKLVDYPGKNVSLVLIQSGKGSKETKEVIMLLEDSKLVSGYLPSTDPQYDLSFNVLREEFAEPKTPSMPDSQEKDFTQEQKIALGFFKQFLNDNDAEGQKDFLNQHILDSMQLYYVRYQSLFASMFEDTDLQIMESTAYGFKDGTEGSLHLFKSSSGEDIIAVLKGTYFIMPYKDSERLEEAVVFQRLRRKFQAS